MRQHFKLNQFQRRLAAWTLGIFLLAAITAVAVFILPCLNDPSPGFNERRGRLVQARETGRQELGNTALSEMTLVSSSGLEVEISVRVPIPIDSPAPLAILLGGHRTGRDAARLVVDTRGVVVAAISYPYRGNPASRGLSLLAQIPQMQQAILDTPPAVLLALDYLLEQSYVDSERVELIGVSLGAFLVSVPGALDSRIGRVWLVHGAGKPAEVLARRLEDHIGFPLARRWAGQVLALLIRGDYLKPERWVGQISPRPVVVVNSRNDEALTASSIESLHRAVRQPAEIIWTEGQHVLPARRQAVEQIAKLVLDRIAPE